MTSFVEVTHDGHVSTLTINRPDKLNALSQEVLSDLRAAIETLVGKDGVRAAVITGTGKAFVAGAACLEGSFCEGAPFEGTFAFALPTAFDGTFFCAFSFSNEDIWLNLIGSQL